ncbi:MAG TPA: HRDC domain-containing protein, partial [Nitrospira sp.]|nr:HRDC domain-containing protein [Nitrospira sp.]
LAILDYFSDEVERALGPCGLCDRCKTPVPLPVDVVNDESACAKAILTAVSWCGGRFGVTRIVEMLRGSRSKGLLAYGAEDCPGYGMYQPWTKTALTRLVKSLIDSGHLQVEGSEYPTLDLTRRGEEVVKGLSSVEVKTAVHSKASSAYQTPVNGPNNSMAASLTSSVDPQLFERLRQLRKELAEEEGVAPFVIFHDKTLRTIAGHKPVTLSALLEIPGIGEVKVERYGRRVLGIVNEECR